MHLGVTQNIRIERNTLDATIVRWKENGVLISGRPQDDGGKGILTQLLHSLQYTTRH